MLVSSTEPKPLHVLGDLSQKPEDYGADILIRPHRNLTRGFNGPRYVAVQRKEIKDLVASVGDGRLGKQVTQMSECWMGILLVEGTPKWTGDGYMLDGWGNRMTKSAWQQILWGIQAEGVRVCYTDSVYKTVEWCKEFETWAKKPDHKSLRGRAGPSKGAWGTRDSRAWQIHMLQGLPGVGEGLAGKILDTVGMPMGLTVSREDLMTVPGLGVKKIDTIMAAIGEP